MKPQSLVFLFILAPYISLGLIINKHVHRILDVSTAILKYTLEVNILTLPTNSFASEVYEFHLPTSKATRVSYISATVNSHPARISAPTIGAANCNTTVYSIYSDLGGNSTIESVTIVAYLTGILVPFPQTIAQGESLYYILEDSHYFFSPYSTETQKTTIKLGSGSHIESYTKLAPSSSKGATITYGSYSNVAPLSISPARIHFANNNPCIQINSLEREVTVSIFGRISTEEVYDLRHCGPQLKGGFSRYDYQYLPRGSLGSIKSLTIQLPSQATNVYYRDQLGNISTSTLKRSSRSSKLELEILPRFPMFGGWQNSFYIGYSVPTNSEIDILMLEVPKVLDYSTWLASIHHIYNELIIPSFISVNITLPSGIENAWSENVLTKIILPEGSFGVQTSSPYILEQYDSIRYTYFDSEINGGSPVVSIHAENLIHLHSEPLVVSFYYRKSHILRRIGYFAVVPIGFFAVMSAYFTFISPSTTKC